MRDIACGDCVLTVMLEIAPRPAKISEPAAAALSLLAEKGLVPPLRYAQ